MHYPQSIELQINKLSHLAKFSYPVNYFCAGMHVFSFFYEAAEKFVL
jgi:hypothetical protein